MKFKHMAAAIAFLGSNLVAGQAFAHAALEGSAPKAGEIVSGSPAEVRLQFNEELEATFSTVKVSDPKGVEVSGIKVEVDKANMKIMHATLPTLPAGAYSVRWSTMTRDGHKTKGTFTFTVK